MNYPLATTVPYAVVFEIVIRWLDSIHGIEMEKTIAKTIGQEHSTDVVLILDLYLWGKSKLLADCHAEFAVCIAVYLYSYSKCCKLPELGIPKLLCGLLI